MIVVIIMLFKNIIASVNLVNQIIHIETKKKTSVALRLDKVLLKYVFFRGVNKPNLLASILYSA